MSRLRHGPLWTVLHILRYCGDTHIPYCCPPNYYLLYLHVTFPIIQLKIWFYKWCAHCVSSSLGSVFPSLFGHENPSAGSCSFLGWFCQCLLASHQDNMLPFYQCPFSTEWCTRSQWQLPPWLRSFCVSCLFSQARKIPSSCRFSWSLMGEVPIFLKGFS